jgi:hypothetical protein
MLVVLKLPVVYLCAVVWWAIKAEPRPLDGVVVRSAPDPSRPCDWRGRLGPKRPNGGRGGRALGSRRVATTSFQARRAVRT